MLVDHVKWKYVLPVLLGLILISGLFGRRATAEDVSDEFIRGYATALLEREFQDVTADIDVRQGVIYLYGTNLTYVDGNEIKGMLSHIAGVKRVEIQAKGAVPAGGASERPKEKENIEPEVPALLPPNLLFAPLIADPRWPHFSASYQRYSNNEQLKDVGSVGFGESFAIYRFAGPWDAIMSLGIQAAVFSIFDLGAPSKDLVNADYFVGIPLTFKKGNFTDMFRVFHQSSHLGDEFILRGRAKERINLSYENLNNILSFDLPLGFRIYGGAGYLFDQDPSDLKPWSTQAGLEFRSPVTWWEGRFRPVGAADIQNHQETNWDTELSLRAGVQLENAEFLSRKLQIMFEYYNGNSPNGQFFAQSIEFWGTGLHFFYE